MEIVMRISFFIKRIKDPSGNSTADVLQSRISFFSKSKNRVIKSQIIRGENGTWWLWTRNVPD